MDNHGGELPLCAAAHVKVHKWKPLINGLFVLSAFPKELTLLMNCLHELDNRCLALGDFILLPLEGSGPLVSLGSGR